MKDLILIDGNSIGFAAHSTRKLNSASGDTTQAIFGFLRTIRAIHVEHANDHDIIVLWDGRSWRKDECEEYKANREATKEDVQRRNDYKKQRSAIAEALAHLGVRQELANNLEADDLIAMRVWDLHPGQKATIISGDRDLIQLVNENVTWVNPIKLPGGKTPKINKVTFQDFAEITGYESSMAYVQAKALLGDASDNLKGVPGIGEKATPLILGHWKRVGAAIKDIRDNGDAAIPPFLSKFRKKLTTFAGDSQMIHNYTRNIRLMHLTRKNLPEPVGLKQIDRKISEEKFKSVCERYGFASIISKFDLWVEPFHRKTISA